MLNFFKAEKILPDSLMAEMRVKMLVKDNRRIWILHDRPLQGPVSYIEFFADSGDIYLNFADGTIRHLGLTIPPGQKRRDIQESELVWLYQLDKNEKIEGYQQAPLINADDRCNAYK
jgi:hypothetical protein